MICGKGLTGESASRRAACAFVFVAQVSPADCIQYLNATRCGYEAARQEHEQL